MAALFHIHLEQVAHVVQRWRGRPEMALLSHRSRFGVALDHQQPAQHRSILTRNVLPGGFTLVSAERDGAAIDSRGKKNTPTILRHLDETEFGPAFAAHTNRGTQIHRRALKP